MSNKTKAGKNSECVCQQLKDKIETIQQFLEENFPNQEMEIQTKEIAILLQEKRILKLELMFSKAVITIASIKSGLKSTQLDDLHDEMLKILKKSILPVIEK